ncbi:hypothetical protein AHMF7605_06830 [Adhaeribacter arboris]|uniref:Uncharacterized protein n=1 Tax=Adhaeribacter arboris TaxID=2072846 RepID=A0A2T2YCN9_9BACT|nr:hypothetical protein [Adhaeribacter arboris]PSR53264.1 hypothetical protein AHMF7605_06830 [Adhaeribacter arboris]
MQNLSDRLIVRKESHGDSSSSYTGIIKVLGISNSDEAFKEVTINEFPNRGQLFVYSKFDKIDEVYTNKELFFINGYEDSPKFLPEIPSSAKYSVIGDKAEDPKKYQLCPIFEKNFDPDKSFKLVVNFLPITYVFIKSNNSDYVYGPFLLQKEEDEADDEYYNVQLRPVTHSELNLSNEYDKCIFKFNINQISKYLISDNGNNFVFNALVLLANTSIHKEVIYYGSNEDILEWGRKNIGNLANIEEKNVKDLFKHLNQIPVVNPGDDLKLDKLKKILVVVKKV